MRSDTGGQSAGRGDLMKAQAEGGVSRRDLRFNKSGAVGPRSAMRLLANLANACCSGSLPTNTVHSRSPFPLIRIAAPSVATAAVSIEHISPIRTPVAKSSCSATSFPHPSKLKPFADYQEGSWRLHARGPSATAWVRGQPVCGPQMGRPRTCRTQRAIAWNGVGQSTNATQSERAIATLYALRGCFDDIGCNRIFANQPINKVDAISLSQKHSWRRRRARLIVQSVHLRKAA